MPLWNLLNPWRDHNDRVARTMDEVLARAERAGGHLAQVKDCTSNPKLKADC